MKYATVCSGIEAPSMGWHELGWSAQWFSEIEPFPSAVLAHHYPNVPNLGDMTKIHETETFRKSTIDVLCGGTPCQSFSQAGLRKGLDDPRGNLMLTFLALARAKQPTWVIWENVPGVLSSNGGRDFGTFLAGLAECGYGWAYRVLDAQYWGLAQRRKRVFVVGCLGDYRCGTAVLLERNSLQGHPAPGRQTRKEVAGNAQNRTGISCVEIAPTLRAGGNKTGGDRPPGTDVDTVETLITTYGIDEECNVTPDGFGPLLRGGQGGTRQAVAFKVRGGCEGGGKGYLGSEESAFTLSTMQDQTVAVFDPNQITSKTNRSQPTPELSHTLPATENSPVAFGWQNSARQGDSLSSQVTPTLDKSKTPAVMQHMAVRRLTPKECARLQGFPDSFLDIDFRGKPATDGVKYKALGNSMAVPVLSWIGKRIQMVDNLTNQTK